MLNALTILCIALLPPLFVWLAAHKARSNPFESEYQSFVQNIRRYYFDKSRTDALSEQCLPAVKSKEDFVRTASEITSKIPYTWVLDCSQIKDCEKRLGPFESKYGVGVDFVDSIRNGDYSVRIKQLDRGIVYVLLPSFESVNIERVANSKELIAAKGIILDLSAHSGGNLDSSIDFCSLFMDFGKVFSVEQRNGSHVIRKVVKLSKANVEVFSANVFSKTNLFQRRYRRCFSQPLVVVVTPLTAGSAEVAAACLKDSVGATLVGAKTRGRGVGSDFSRRDDLITGIASYKYCRPNGQWIGCERPASGVFPDNSPRSSTDWIKSCEAELTEKIRRTFQIHHGD